jgi:uncharacterized membrane protein YraQ (UPF0718 family)
MRYFDKLPLRIKFLSAVILIYVITVFVSPDYAENAFLSAFKTFINILPLLLLVFFIMFIANIYIKPETIKKHLGHDSGIKGWLYAVIGAMVFPGPPYVMFPFLGEIKKHGMKYSLAAVFLNNRSIQPAFLPVMAHYFGLPFTIIISIYVFIFSIPTALLIGKVLKKKAPIGAK